MTEENQYDCTDCKHYGICYLRRHKDNDNPCKDLEVDEWVKEIESMDVKKTGDKL